MQTTETPKMDAISRALAAAKARKAAKAAAAGEAPVTDTIPAAPPETEVTLEERAAAKVKRDEERAARKAAKAEKEAAEAAAKAERKAARAAKKAAKATAPDVKKGPAHMKKVDRARSKLPALAAEATRMFEDATANLSIPQIEALANHLLVQARAMKTLRAADITPLPLGATVRVTGGDPKYVGAVGEVIHSQKLRAKVRLPGMPEGKYVYIYTGEAEVVAPDAEAAAE